MTDGSGLQGRQERSPPQARQEAQGSRPAPEGGTEEVAYLAERTAAQDRKIELSMMRKRGFAPTGDPQDRNLMGGVAQTRTDNQYNPRRW